MRKLILVVHTSLDGYVASVKGDFSGFEAGEENLQFVCEITETADAALFGRVSYQLLNSHWPTAKDLPNATDGTVAYSKWYNNAQKIVISKTLRDEGMAKTIILRDGLLTAIQGIKNQEGKDILIFGSPSIAQLLMQHDLIDGYWIFINPAIFGQGIPLFKSTAKHIKLKLEKRKELENGELALYYALKKVD